MDGAIRVGLDAGELETLARATGVLKLSRADLPYAISTRQIGATTVAATIICANLAGICGISALETRPHASSSNSSNWSPARITKCAAPRFTRAP